MSHCGSSLWSGGVREERRGDKGDGEEGDWGWPHQNSFNIFCLSRPPIFLLVGVICDKRKGREGAQKHNPKHRPGEVGEWKKSKKKEAGEEEEKRDVCVNCQDREKKWIVRIFSVYWKKIKFIKKIDY